jgi:ABC-type glycerol-3-phosphate transport system permease component
VKALFLLLTAVALLLAIGPLAYLVNAASGDGGRSFFAEPAATDWLINSVWVAGAQTLLAMLVSAAGGFAIAAYRFRGRSIVIAVLVATLLLPGAATVTGLFEVVAIAMGGFDTFWAVILPGGLSVFGIGLFAAAFRSVPASRLEAARLDGCGELRLWWSIALPAVRPTTGAFVLLQFLAGWNALLWPATILIDERKQTVAVAINDLARRADYEADPAKLAAAVLISLLPVAGVFLLCANTFVKGDDVGPGRRNG